MNDSYRCLVRDSFDESRTKLETVCVFIPCSVITDGIDEEEIDEIPVPDFKTICDSISCDIQKTDRYNDTISNFKQSHFPPLSLVSRISKSRRSKVKHLPRAPKGQRSEIKGTFTIISCSKNTATLSRNKRHNWYTFDMLKELNDLKKAGQHVSRPANLKCVKSKRKKNHHSFTRRELGACIVPKTAKRSNNPLTLSQEDPELFFRNEQ